MKNPCRCALYFALALVWSVPQAQAQAPEIAGAPTVVDARTLAFDDRRVRLSGIVTPERGDVCPLGDKTIPCGRVAMAALQDLFAGARVRCRVIGRAADGAELAQCSAQRYDLGEGMVYTGWARPAKGAPARYFEVQDDARKRQRGLWKGRFPAAVDAAAGG